ncbi:MAG: RIP metalloprotease RseP [Lachnospiraceae bacterium]|nr:RIP metalloprotease RseP [Lachnospiraceae bacterium]
MSFISIVLAIVILGILVLVHEFGHFLLAKKNGVFVKEFSIGFGPRIVSHVAKSGTRFSWKAIPFGGSCQMLGALEDEDDETDDERSFDKKSVWARMSIILAGPVFNFFLAFILSVIVIGTSGYDPATVTYVAEGSPVYEAGLREGDIITNYNGEAINFGREIYLEEYLHPLESDKEAITITYLRDGKKQKIRVFPQKVDYYILGLSYYTNENEAKIAEITEGGPFEQSGLDQGDVILQIADTEIKTGQDLGNYFNEHPITANPIHIKYLHRGVVKETDVMPQKASAYVLGFDYNIAKQKTNVGGVLKYSFAEMRYQILSVFKGIGFLFSGRGSLDMLSGPVGIVEVIGTTYDASAPAGFFATLINMLSIVILLSANLGVINLLPIPAMDGGKFLLLIIEAIRRKPINKKHEGIITVVGAVLIMILAIVVLINDITKFF